MSEGHLEINNDFGQKIILDKANKSLTFSDAATGRDELTINAADHSLTVDFEKITLKASSATQDGNPKENTGVLTISIGDGDSITIHSSDNLVQISTEKTISVSMNGLSVITINNNQVTISTSLGVTIDSPSIALGKGATPSLVNEDFIGLFNEHVHAQGGIAAPATQAVIGTHSTTLTKAK